MPPFYNHNVAQSIKTRVVQQNHQDLHVHLNLVCVVTTNIAVFGYIVFE